MRILFDDARPGGEATSLLFEQPAAIVRADSEAEVRGALDALRAALAAGQHVAGYLAYEAGFALDPALEGQARAGEGPLLLFGVFEAPRRVNRAALLAGAGEARVDPPRPLVTRAAYLEAVRAVHEALHAGDYYQANLTFPCDLGVTGDPFALYARLAAAGGGGWGGVLEHDAGALVSLSPEQFFRLEDGVLTARPMKGTAPRRADPAADAAEAAALARDAKQRAENLMIVDLLRNDLARVAETGTVDVPELFSVETYPTVHQMTSRVTARLRPRFDAVDVLEKLFPCGSVTGAPKIAAMQALVNLEPHPRGAYTGSMGWIAPPGAEGAPGNAAFNVLIRTIEIVAQRSRARLGLGSGLVVDSAGGNEWRECLLKGQFVTSVADPFDLIETMAYDPIDGIVDLERHLARLKGTAADLGFVFDRHDARNELQAATFGHRRPAFVRLLAARGGGVAIELLPLPDSPEEPVSVQVKPLPVDPDDRRLRHKTSDRAFYDEARDPAIAFETIFERPDGQLTEGSFTNIFVEREGKLVTPPAALGLLPGVLRQRLIEEGRAVEGHLTRADLEGGLFIGNSVRGLVAARLVSGG
ncbi:aminodeoxychorismate synthase component I [Sphingomicrobium astaxanthinifaciens]|uniref:aminodeoxychorismate synthase component I n=1 Tax=Sphingomicrobium astaxanthinifaciens TaxID=1227949 RepID=UPI001FCADEB3|nr:aminodeoxychorismate synthase component I [Sphingomicrobium astaxanthinifaciens]MCJ7420910.1 aminodeoxychorismate synthase component I [Sphingomicrobium astaxanthinifaciens]